MSKEIHFHRALERLKQSMLEMGELVEKAIQDAITALLERTKETTLHVIKGDHEIDAKEVEIEEECLKLLALYQPIAHDLRFIASVMKINNDLERMGDLAVNIAERAAFLISQPALGISIGLGAMTKTTRKMVRESLDALVHTDVQLARHVCEEDDTVDEAQRLIYEKLTDVMEKDPSTIERATHLLSTSRHLERIADLATNIAEDIVYLVDGEIIRHRVEEYQPRQKPS